MTPNKGPKKAAIVSINAKIPIWLRIVNQKIPIKNPNMEIIILELLTDKDDGIKLINEY